MPTSDLGYETSSSESNHGEEMAGPGEPDHTNGQRVINDALKYKPEHSSDSEEEPESVTFSAGRDQALSDLHKVAELVSQEKQREKDWRRRRQERNEEQKRKRLQRLVNTRLPDDIVEALKDVPQEVPENEATRKHVKPIRIPKEGEKKKKKRQSKDEVVVTESTIQKPEEDFVPLGSAGGTSFGAVVLKESRPLMRNAASIAAEFRQKMLYGKRIKRDPVGTLLSYQIKLQAAGKDKLARVPVTGDSDSNRKRPHVQVQNVKVKDVPVKINIPKF